MCIGSHGYRLQSLEVARSLVSSQLYNNQNNFFGSLFFPICPLPVGDLLGQDVPEKEEG